MWEKETIPHCVGLTSFAAEEHDVMHDLSVVDDGRGGDHVNIVSDILEIKDGALVGGLLGRDGGHREANGQVIDSC